MASADRWELTAAVKAGDIRKVEQLLGLASGKPVEPDDNSRIFTLFLAAYNGRMDIAKLLLDAGVDPDAKDPGNGDLYPPAPWNALHTAAAEGQVGMVRLLLARGANVEATVSRGGGTALTEAAYKGREDVVRVLLEEGHADIDAKQADGRTALIMAAINDNTGTVKLLLEAGADRSVRDAERKTALDYASQIVDNSDPSYQSPERNPETARLIRAYFPKPAAKPAAAPPVATPKLFVPKPKKPLKLLPQKKPPAAQP